jgi:NADPH-dependent 2,4-dienoyl-CoA reductase/sulfur reductase-like enzyme
VDRIVIVGASLAGVHAADALREHGFNGDLAIIGAEPHLPYDRPPLSKDVLRGTSDLIDLQLHDQEWYDERAIRLRLATSATGLDPLERVLALEDGQEVPYDGLVIATGSRARRHHPDAEGIRYLRDRDDAAALARDLPEARHVVVVGGGFLGLEIAATARSMGIEVAVVEIGPQPLNRTLGDELGSWVCEHHRRHGTRVYCSRYVTALRDGAVELDDGTLLRADLVVAGVGAEPNVAWLCSSGVDLGDGVRCDASMAACVPNVVAAGDVARWYNPLFDEEMRIEQWTNAVEQSRHAVRTLLGDRRAYTPVPYQWTDQYGARMVFVGRANATDQVRIERADDSSLVAVLGRDGVHVGALCVNAPRALAGLRAAIAERRPFATAV